MIDPVPYKSPNSFLHERVESFLVRIQQPMGIQMPCISILMPVYNRETLVVQAIRSIQDQTFQDWELVILDDASTDSSLIVCRSIAQEDSRIRVFAHEKNLGVGASRNTLASLARGKYIAHQDSDDLSVPDRLSLQHEILESMPEVGLVCGICEWIDMDGNALGRHPELLVKGKQFPQERSALVHLLFQGNIVQNPACMFRRSILSEIPGPFDHTLRMSSDWRFTLDVAHRARIFGISKVVVKVRRGSGHDHLWKDRESGFVYTRKCLRGVYRDYKHYGSGISYFQYRKAMAAHLLRPYAWSRPKYQRLLKAIIYDPTNKRAWMEAFRIVQRIGKRVVKVISDAE